MIAVHVAQLVREDVPLMVNGRAFLIKEEVGRRGLDPYAAGRVNSAKRVQWLQDDRLPTSFGYRLAQFTRAETVRQVQEIDLLLTPITQTALVDFWQGHGNPPRLAVRYLLVSGSHEDAKTKVELTLPGIGGSGYGR
jgi:hypothetical protein